MSKSDSTTDGRAEQPATRHSLHVIQIGGANSGATASLSDQFDLSFSSLPGPPGETREDLGAIGGEINRRIDDAGGWILLLREGEAVNESLAGEISRVLSDKPVAWAYRIAVAEYYCGGPLFRATRKAPGEIRLFHGRRCRFLPRGEGRELQSKGTVIRLHRPLIRESYGSEGEHRTRLESSSLRVRILPRIAHFSQRLWRDRRRLTTRAIRFHWLESGWDVSDES